MNQYYPIIPKQPKTQIRKTKTIEQTHIPEQTHHNKNTHRTTQHRNKTRYLNPYNIVVILKFGAVDTFKTYRGYV